MSWQRARKPSQKQVRREEILEAAKRLFESSSYEEVSLNSIARAAGMSKPNVYRYFSSREEIFLQILLEQQSAFVQRLAHRLESQRDGEAAVDDIVGAWIDTALESPGLLALLPQLGTSMEKNSSLDDLVAFKKDSFAGADHLAAIHHKLYPGLSLEIWGRVLNCAVGLLAGLWPLCNGPEVVEAAMRHPRVGLEPWDFQQMMGFALRSLIVGAGQGSKAAPAPNP